MTVNLQLKIVGNRFSFGQSDPDHLLTWYDVTDRSTIDMLLKMERRDLLWEGRFSLGVELAAQLRTAGLLTEPPLPTSEYVESLRRLSEEVGEHLPDYIRRVREELEK